MLSHAVRTSTFPTRFTPSNTSQKLMNSLRIKETSYARLTLTMFSNSSFTKQTQYCSWKCTAEAFFYNQLFKKSDLQKMILFFGDVCICNQILSNLMRFKQCWKLSTYLSLSLDKSQRWKIVFVSLVTNLDISLMLFQDFMIFKECTAIEEKNKNEIITFIVSFICSIFL